jgi:hypothetical protein
MKKATRKLTLSRETLVHLGEDALKAIHGGGPTADCTFDCNGVADQTSYNCF